MSFNLIKNEQLIHEKFLKTLRMKTDYRNSLEQNSSKNYENSCYNYQQYQWKLQSRQDRRKLEYERIQKENYKFSEKLINAKAFLNRHEQKLFFDKHCELKQRLQRIPTNNSITMLNKSKQSSFLIYNDQLKEKQSHSLQQ